MDEIVLRAMARWPNTPAVYGWLKLDARGNWRLRNPATDLFEPIGNAALREFIGRNYAADERGRWFFQNGPQKVFVGLERAPLVYRLDGNALVDHCGRRAARIQDLWLDESATVYARGEHGPGSLDDRDLLALSERLVDAASESVDVSRLNEPELPEGLAWASAYGSVLLRRISHRDLQSLFGFVAEPAPDTGERRG